MKKLTYLLFIIISFMSQAQEDLKTQWVKSFPSGNITPYDVCSDNLDNVYVTGVFSGTVDFDFGSGIAQETSLTSNLGTNNANQFVVKYDSQGNYIWHAVYGKGGFNYANIKIYIFNNTLYITSGLMGVGDVNPSATTLNYGLLGNKISYIVKSSLAGVFISAMYIGNVTLNTSNEAIIRDLDVNSLGEVFITGHFNNTVDFNPSATTNNLSSGGLSIYFPYVAKYSSSFGYLYSKSFISNSDKSEGNTIKIDNNGDLYIGGAYRGTGDFDPGAGVQNSTATASGYTFTKTGYLLKLSSAGNYISHKTFDGPTIYDQSFITDIDINSSNEMFLCGRVGGSIDLDLTSGTNYIISTSTKPNFFCKYNSSGVLVWKLSDDISVNSFKMNGTNLIVSGQNNNKSKVIKINSAGNIISSKTFGTVSSVSTLSYAAIALSGSSNIISIGKNLSLTNDNFITSGINQFVSLNQGYIHSINTCFSDTITTNISIIEGNSVNWQGDTYNSTGLYFKTFYNTKGCDSILKLNLIVNSNLPITLTSFTSECNDRINHLNWITASEHNSSHYILEKSNNGINWTICDSLLAAGNSESLMNYSSFIPAVDELTYFRLKQVDKDGQKYYYGPISSICEKNNDDLFMVLSNPSFSEIEMILLNPNEKDLNIDVLSSSGSRLFSEITKKNGVITYANIPAGIYFIEVSNEKKKTIKKVVIY